MHHYYPVYDRHFAKNKRATTSLVLSIVSIVSLGLILPLFIIGGLLLSMAGQPPQAAGIDPDDLEALEVYDRESRILRNTAYVLFPLSPALALITGILGLVFGIIGVRNPGKHGQAIAGIVISGFTIFAGILILLIMLLI